MGKCIITYKGKKYSEEQFKEYFINNKQEFATSIAKNKDVIDSFKRKMEGIDFIFSQSPELASVGSKAQYLQYLSTIFPNSKVKDIVYHGTRSQEKFDFFDENKIGELDSGYFGKGFYFSPDLSYADGYSKLYNGYNIAALVNLKNPLETDANQANTNISLINNDGAIVRVGENLTPELNSENYNPNEIGEIVVSTTEQIHILGGKNDIEGFKEFVRKSQEGKQMTLFNVSANVLEKEIINGFLLDFGITVTEYENLKDEIGIDSYTAADLITKSIAYEKGESILPEVAYFAYSMLGKQNNKLRSELRYLINKWDKYQERFNYHANTIKQKEGFIKNSEEWKNKIRDLVIIDFLKDNLTNYYLNKKEFTKILDTKWTREDFSLWNKIISIIEDFLSKFSEKYKNQKEKLENIGLGIANEVITRNYEYFNYSLGQDQIQKYYNDTINSDPFAKELIEFAQKELGLVLTGSLALRRAGTVYRTSDETIHDIDWVVPYELNSSENNRKTLNDIQKYQGPDKDYAAAMALSYVEELDWFKKFKEKYPSYQLINGFYGVEHNSYESFTVQGVIDGKFYNDSGTHEETFEYYKKDPITKKPVKVKETIIKKHKKGDWIKDTGHVIDFFIRLERNQEEHENYFKLWKEIMIAKLKMGRDKDFIDWKAFTPYLKSKDSFNFNYEGFRHKNYESSKSYALDDIEEKHQYNQESSKQNIQGFKDFVQGKQFQEQSLDNLLPSNNDINADYLKNKINDTNKEILERKKEYQQSIKIENTLKSRALSEIEEKNNILKEKLLPLGFKEKNKELVFLTNSYITLIKKQKELSDLAINFHNKKINESYELSVRPLEIKETYELQKTGKLPFTPMETKKVIEDVSFLDDLSNNIFEGLSDLEKDFLKEKIKIGEYKLTCKI